MTNYAAATGCSARAHRRDLKHYDKLPDAIRDKLKVARDEMCSACVRNMLRRQGLEQTLHFLDHERTHRQVVTRRGVFLVAEPEIKP